ncbi:MAG TPA: universal stress protein [Acidimicrobiales bacterium]|nr:universal stress protein [Acidimicrobiales bacterium]
MRVFVGIDGSAASCAALHWAASFVELEGGDLVVAAVRVPPYTEVWPEQMEERRALETERLEQACAGIGDAVPIRQYLLEGDPGAELLLAADSEDADLIVVGARGSGGHRHALHLGSTAHHLVHHTRIPLAAIPASARAVWPAPIVIGVDGSEGTERAVAWLADYGPLLTDDVIAVHAEKPLAQWVPVSHPNSWYQHALNAMQGWVEPLRKVELGARTLVLDGDAVDALTDVALEQHAGMIVVGARGAGRTGASRLGATALKVLNQAQVPVLMVPAGM